MEKSIEAMEKILIPLAKTLGLTIQTIWPWFVYQQYLNALLAWLFLFLVCLGIVIWKKWMVVAHLKEMEKSRMDQNEGILLSTWVLGATLAILFIISIIAVFNMGFAFLNPEYYALKSLLSVCK
jgi:hypothetical protein